MSEPRCQSDMNASEQTFTTPNYPHNYFNNYDCHWVIRAAAGTFIRSCRLYHGVRRAQITGDKI